MAMRAIAILAAGVSLMALGDPRPAQAQTDQPAAGTGLQEVVVTARRREEKLQTVPLSVQAVSAGKLEQQRIQDVTDLQAIVPAFNSYASTGRDTQYFTMRGQYAVPGGPGVVSYFNSIPDLGIPNIGLASASGGGGPGHFYDLENVQVLKGPQGTLFGQNTTGGAILFQPKKPTNQFEGYGSLIFGNLGDKEVEAAVNVPIIDDVLLARFSGTHVVRDGFTKDLASGQELDNRDYWAFRGSIVWRPTDNFENYLVADNIYSHNNGTSYVLNYVKPFNKGLFGGGAFTLANVWDDYARLFGLGPNFVENLLAKQNALGPRVIVGQFGEGFGPLRSAFLGLAGESPASSLSKIEHFTLDDIATYDVNDDVTVKNLFGWQRALSLSRSSEAPIPGYEFTTKNGENFNLENFVEELQMQGRAMDGKLTWQLGGYLNYTHPVGLQQTNESVIVLESNPIVTANVARTQAVYTQETYDLGGLYAPLEGLKLTGGFRYNWDHRSVFATYPEAIPAFHVPPGVTCLNLAVPPACQQSGSASFEAGTWIVSLDYALTPETLLYVTGRRGYISGGVNTESLIPPKKYAPEFLVDMEAGVKSTWELFDIKARTNADAFIGYLKNYQAPNFINYPPGSTGQAQVVENVGKATISGLELESDWLLFPGFDLTFNYAYTYAHYNEIGALFSSGPVLDPTFPAVPKHKFSLIGAYTLPFIPDSYGKVTPAVTWNWTSSFDIAFLTDHQPGYHEPHYGVVDIRVDWNDVLGYPFDIDFFMKNVTDRLYRVGAFTVNDQLGFESSTYAEPRTWGFQLKYRFGGSSAEPEIPAAPYTAPAPQAVAPSPRSYLVFFDFNKSDLTAQAKTIVDQAAANAGPAKVTRLTVTGHTDTVGSDAYNMRLSRRRADSVAAQLEKDGIPSSEIEIVAKGKRDLLVPTADGVKEPQNRRVQIVYDGGPAS